MSDANAPAPPSSGAQAPPEAAPKPAEATPPSEPRKHKLTVRGAEVQLTDAEYVDLIKETYGEGGVKEIGQLSRAAREEMRKIGSTKKEIDAFLADLDDPKKLIAGLARRKFGGDVSKARAYVEAGYAYDIDERNTPEEKKLESRVEALKREEQEILAQRAARDEQARADAAVPQFAKMFNAALGAAGVTTANERIRSRMIADMARDVGAEWGDCRTEEERSLLVRETAKAIAERYEDGSLEGLEHLPDAKRQAAIAKLLPSDGGKLLELLGEERMRAIRAADVARTKARNANGQFSGEAAPPKPKPVTNGERKPYASDFDFGKR